MILPGIAISLGILNNSTNLIDTEIGQSQYPSLNTKDAVTTGILTSIQGAVNLVCKKLPSDLPILLTGGDADLIYDQSNYTSGYSYGSADPLVNFEHDYVFRASLTDLFGDPIPQSSTTADNIFVQNITTSVPSNVSDSDNLSVVAIVVNSSGNGTPGSSNSAINVRSAFFGETQDLQEL